MKNQLTPVEWFENELNQLDIEIPQSIFEEAKEIEKEQIRKYNDLLNKILIHIDWSYENWTSNDGKIIETEIKELIKKATELT